MDIENFMFDKLLDISPDFVSRLNNVMSGKSYSNGGLNLDQVELAIGIIREVIPLGTTLINKKQKVELLKRFCNKVLIFRENPSLWYQQEKEKQRAQRKAKAKAADKAASAHQRGWAKFTPAPAASAKFTQPASAAKITPMYNCELLFDEIVDFIMSNEDMSLINDRIKYIPSCPFIKTQVIRYIRILDKLSVDMSLIKTALTTIRLSVISNLHSMLIDILKHMKN